VTTPEQQPGRRRAYAGFRAAGRLAAISVLAAVAIAGCDARGPVDATTGARPGSAAETTLAAAVLPRHRLRVPRHCSQRLACYRQPGDLTLLIATQPCLAILHSLAGMARAGGNVGAPR
jgi:hypothetical protein